MKERFAFCCVVDGSHQTSLEDTDNAPVNYMPMAPTLVGASVANPEYFADCAFDSSPVRNNVPPSQWNDKSRPLLGSGGNHTDYYNTNQASEDNSAENATSRV